MKKSSLLFLKTIIFKNISNPMIFVMSLLLQHCGSAPYILIYNKINISKELVNGRVEKMELKIFRKNYHSFLPSRQLLSKRIKFNGSFLSLESEPLIDNYLIFSDEQLFDKEGLFLINLIVSASTLTIIPLFSQGHQFCKIEGKIRRKFIQKEYYFDVNKYETIWFGLILPFIIIKRIEEVDYCYGKLLESLENDSLNPI